MTTYLVYICQAVRDRAGLERYWRDAPAAQMNCFKTF